MQTYFGYFGYAWLHSPKMIVFSVYLHAKNKLHNSLLSYNITIFWPITCDPKLCQIYWWNINNNISFHYRLFLRKTSTTKLFKKSQKTLIWAHSGPFCPNLDQKWIFLEKRAQLSVFQYSNYLTFCQKSEKSMEPFLRKLLDGHT